MTIFEILLVDDNPADTDLVRDLLLGDEFPGHVWVVADGLKALAFLRQEAEYSTAVRPDLVFLDLNLPRRDGRSVLSEIKADPKLRNIPCVIFSTSEAQRDVSQSYALGANCYVSKPGNLSDYISAVTTIKEFWFRLARLPREEK